MNRKSYWNIPALVALTLVFSALTFLTDCGGSSSKTPPVITIAATSGGGQSAVVGAAFTNPLTATVMSGTSPAAGVTVTFTSPAATDGTFPSSALTATATTNSSGVATSPVFTAGTTAGTYTVTASAAGATVTANFSLTNTAVVIASSNYSFYLSGQELINAGPNLVVLAGSVTIDATGNVLAGEQDYNDAFGITSPQPSGDTITGGTLTVDPTTGQGTLTLITDNTALGVGGTETLAVQFVNTNHALISQFDGSAASSGSMDLQTLPSTPSGGFAFAVSGVDSGYLPTATAGVFTITGTAVAGVTDQNDNGTVTLNQAFTGTLSAADAFGRGTLTITGSSGLINYYVVGPEVVRIINVDATDASVGSAFGQGAGAFTNASLGASVLAMANNPFSGQNGEVGQFTTSSTSSNTANFAGVGEGNELANGVATTLASAITGTYTIGSNGYGSLTVGNGGLGDAATEGIYMTDPTLNLNDPNNPTGGGGALVLSLDAVLAGTTGVLVPQSDTLAADFTGNYAAGMQEFNSFTACTLCEFDAVAQGSVTAGVLSLTGDVSDPFLTLGAGATGLYTGATFTSTPLADTTNAGRYSMLSTNTVPNALEATINGIKGSFDATMYQASGAQLFWLEFDSGAVWLGPVQQQGSLAGLPAVKQPAPKTQVKRKR
jgi:hypothetical protein